MHYIIGKAAQKAKEDEHALSDVHLFLQMRLFNGLY
jgi:hypothetical protein